LAQTISLGPAGDGEEGQDWVLTYTPEKRDESDREKILVRLTPRSLHELYVETKGLSADRRTHGHSAECGLCGEQVNLDEQFRTRVGAVSQILLGKVQGCIRVVQRPRVGETGNSRERPLRSLSCGREDRVETREDTLPEPN
jgi:hypothetical protein